LTFLNNDANFPIVSKGTQGLFDDYLDDWFAKSILQGSGGISVTSTTYASILSKGEFMVSIGIEQHERKSDHT
jgi:hypothetical protein